MADGWMGPKTPAITATPNICKPLLVSPPPPPPPAVTTSAPFIEESGEIIAVAKGKSGTDRRLRSESDFSSMRFSTSIVIGPGVRIAKESKQSRKGGYTNIEKHSAGCFVAVLLFFEDLPLYLFLAYTREWKMRMLASLLRWTARVRCSPFSRRSYNYSLLFFFLYLCISLSLSYISYLLTFAPSLAISLLLFPASTDLYTTLSACTLSRELIDPMYIRARAHVRIYQRRAER